MVNNTQAYKMAIINLRTLLGKIGRHEFRSYGYAKQLRGYRLRVASHQSKDGKTAINNKINMQFLAVTDAETREEILSSMANHYGITKAAALAELSHEEAEHLLDYLTGAIRTATNVLMRRHNLVPA
jgi:hypothetical protein